MFLLVVQSRNKFRSSTSHHRSGERSDQKLTATARATHSDLSPAATAAQARSRSRSRSCCVSPAADGGFFSWSLRSLASLSPLLRISPVANPVQDLLRRDPRRSSNPRQFELWFCVLWRSFLGRGLDLDLSLSDRRDRECLSQNRRSLTDHRLDDRRCIFRRTDAVRIGDLTGERFPPLNRRSLTDSVTHTTTAA